MSELTGSKQSSLSDLTATSSRKPVDLPARDIQDLLPDPIFRLIMSHLAVPVLSSDDFLCSLVYTQMEWDEMLKGRSTLLKCSQVSQRFAYFAQKALYTCLVPLCGNDWSRSWVPLKRQPLLSNHTASLYQDVEALRLPIARSQQAQSLILASIPACSMLRQLSMDLAHADEPLVHSIVLGLKQLNNVVSVDLCTSERPGDTIPAAMTSLLMVTIAQLPRLRYLKLWQFSDPSSYSSLLRKRQLKVLAFAHVGIRRNWGQLCSLLGTLGRINELAFIGCLVPLGFYSVLHTAGVTFDRVTIFPPSRGEARELPLNIDHFPLYSDSVRFGYLSSSLHLVQRMQVVELQISKCRIRPLVTALLRIAQAYKEGLFPRMQRIRVCGFVGPEESQLQSLEDMMANIDSLVNYLEELIKTTTLSIIPKDIFNRLRGVHGPRFCHTGNIS